MWSDNDIDNAFQRLNPPEPEPAPFPLDAWLRLETELDKAVIERAVRQKLLRFFAAEVIVVALVALGWLLWPAGAVAPATKNKIAATATTGARTTLASATSIAQTTHTKVAPAVTKAAVAIASPAVPATVAPTAAATTTTAAAAPATSGVVTTTAAVATGKGPASPHLSAAITPNTRRSPFSAHTYTTESQTAATALAPGLIGSAAAHTRNGIYHTKVASAEASRSVTAASTFNAGSLSASKTRSRGALATGKPYSTESRNAAALGRRTGSQANRQRHTGHDELAAAQGSAPVSDAGKDAPASTETSVASTDFAALALQPVALTPADFAALPAPLATVAVAEAPAKAEVPAPVRQPRLYVGLVVAPDFTTVKFANVESPLPNVGLTLEYRLGSRLRVSTGVLRAKKQYMARRDDYDWGTYKTLVYKHNFEDVDGACTVLDIPLNLRYDLLVRPQYRLFGSLGLSSFFMQREHYTYDYEENNMYKVWDGGNIINQNRHFLSILNLSAGYERSLSSRWSLQAEPYLKVPLAGVGVGKVKLTSAGIFLGLKYGF